MFDHKKITQKLLVVGLGGPSKIAFYKALTGFSCDLIIACDEKDNPPEKYFYDIISVNDLGNHYNDTETCRQLASEISRRGHKVDGVLTLWEDCAPLASLVAGVLGCPCNGYNSALMAKSKKLTQDALRNSREPAVRSLSSRCSLCNTIDELQCFASEIGFPCLIKLEYGSSAAGVFILKELSDCRRYWIQIKNQLRSENDWPGIGLGFDQSIVVTELHEGSEHDIDIVMWEGQEIASFSTDNGCFRGPFFSETSAIMPSVQEEKAKVLLSASAELACREIGLLQGVFNVEFILTAHGPKVIDINGRMGGFYIRDWIRRIWKYDLLEAVVDTALGNKPRASQRPFGVIIGFMLLPSAHASWLESPANVQKLKDLQSNDLIWSQFEYDLHQSSVVDEPFGSIAVHDIDVARAFKRLMEISEVLGITKVDPNISTILSNLATGEAKNGTI